MQITIETFRVGEMQSFVLANKLVIFKYGHFLCDNYLVICTGSLPLPSWTYGTRTPGAYIQVTWFIDICDNRQEAARENGVLN